MNPYSEIEYQWKDMTPETYKKMSLEKRQDYIDNMVKEIRKINKFPVNYFTEEEAAKEILSVVNKEVSFKDENTIDIHSSRGINFLNSIFPNIYKVKSRYKKAETVYDKFFDDEKLARYLDIGLHYKKFSTIPSVFFLGGSKHYAASNYNCLRAKAVYERWCPPNGVVFDYSCGFGGRLLGCASSKHNFTYIGTDPNTETYGHLMELKEMLEKNLGSNIVLYNSGSEDVKLENNSIDLCFSCPPFYKAEFYCDEKTQSTEKYDKYEDWLNEYVRLTIRNCYNSLKDTGIFAVDLMNYYINKQSRYYDLCGDWRKIAEEEGFFFKNKILVNTKTKKQNIEDYEYILVFTKSNIDLPNYEYYENAEKYYKLVKEQKKEELKIRKKINKYKDKYIAQYNAFGEKEKIYRTLTDVIRDEKLDLEELKDNISKQVLYNNHYYKIYNNEDEILNTIPVKFIYAEIDGIYFDSITQIAKYLQCSKQAVSQSRNRHSKKISGKPVTWYYQ